MPISRSTHQIETGPDPLAYVDQEWLLANGTGAFAMGTVPGVNTRRYHGLLVASMRPPVARIVALNQMLEQVVVTVGGQSSVWEFTSCAFLEIGGPGQVYSPGGAAHLVRFERGRSIIWTYVNGDIELTRELQLHWKQQAAAIRYKVRRLAQAGQPAPQAITLRLAPMVTLRDFHHLLLSSRDGGIHSIPGADSVVVQRPGAGGGGPLSISLRVLGSKFTLDTQCWRRIYYSIEKERGQDFEEDNFVPGWFELALDSAAGGEAVITVALGEQPAPPLPISELPTSEKGRAKLLNPIIDRIAEMVKDVPPSENRSNLPAILAQAADDFVVDRWVQGQRLSTIIAGYPWFADWGRDTFIALPGLLLATGRFDDARSIFKTFAGSLRNGLVPNVFDDYNAGAAHYNTVDASLWFVHAAMEYVQASGDQESWRGWLAQACMDVVDAYITGTNPPDAGPGPGGSGGGPLIHMAGDGLITAGSARTQLTWMDAARDGTIFTPRAGKAVEINALWFHVLTGMAHMLADTHQGKADHYTKLTARIGRAFSKIFWDETQGYLNDHVWTDAQGEEHVDRTLRPNQILAVSLAHSPLPRKRQLQVLAAVREKLLTPMGLRTLAPGDPHYHGRYEGSPFARDEAYHQGTVWPWLIGPYAEAVLRLGKFSPAARVEAWQAIEGLITQLESSGLGQLHEIFDADEPHLPRGCIAQAWSVAEVIRVAALAAAKQH